MDRLEALGTSLSQITMYDIKSMYNQAKNVVLNVSEIEAKVREATNDDPWGASSTLMQDIANRTFNYPDFNEIMPSIYSRFMEKEAKQWRQIYKALQLLEYLIKNGSERVVDDARSHISTIKMLRNFHYIDEKGKDEGVNVRNRSRELVELLSDVEKIRGERRKAKSNKHKYIGTGNDGMAFSGAGDGGRYGGFGNDSGGYSGGGGGGGSSDYYGSGGGGGGSHSSGFRDERRTGGFDEYNAGDDEIDTTSPTRGPPVAPRSPPTRRSTAPTQTTPAPAPAPPRAPAPILDLFDDDDNLGAFNSPSAPAPAPPAKVLPTPAPVNVFDDDDFGEFQTVPVPGQALPPAVAAKPTSTTFMDLMASSSTATTTSPYAAQPMKPAMGMGAGIGLGLGMPQQQQQQQGHRYTGSLSSPPLQPQAPNYMSPMQAQRPTPTLTPTGTASPKPTPKPAAGAGFDDLWSMSLGSASASPGATKPTGAGGVGMSMKALEKEKANAGLWGGQGGSNAKPPDMGMGMGGGMSMNMGGSGGGGSTSTIDDLLG
ncbi:hypothetical protein C8F01DRAFT_1136960 [Mycena amicta]|nr:hypothetical protein C8F01DRAFT_1136960 [Mycena amicta]